MVWSTDSFNFINHKEGTLCTVICKDGVIRNATAWKYIPTCSDPQFYFDEWITNSDDCLDKENGRLQDNQQVVGWKLV